MLRQIALTVRLILETAWNGDAWDVVVVDQLSLCVPVLRLLAPVLFYCHFPDKYLSTDYKQPRLLKRIYRWPLDRLEEATTRTLT
jgi:alpha-1,3/alpha-1,6-mannosyltransferase